MIHREIKATLEKELSSDKAVILTGMRRVGKTTLIRSLYDAISDRRKLFLDLENPLSQEYFAETDYEKIKITLDQLAKGRGKDLIVFLDEIQNVKSIPSIVKYLSDHYKTKFVLTGSTSFYLKNLFSESLAGRKRLFELYPLNLKEFIRFKNPDLTIPEITEKITKPRFLLFEKYLSEFIHYGGFPSVATSTSAEEKLAELGDIYTSYFQKEIQILADFRRIESVRHTMKLILQRVSSKLDIAKLSQELGISRITLLEYIDFLEGTFFLKRIGAYSKSVDVTLRAQQKPYIIDNGFLTLGGSLEESKQLENAVFNLLRPNYDSVYYYQSKGGAEIDFIVQKEKQEIAFEVKTTAHPKDAKRVEKTAKKLGLSDWYIVSKHFSPLPRVIYPFQI